MDRGGCRRAGGGVDWLSRSVVVGNLPRNPQLRVERVDRRLVRGSRYALGTAHFVGRARLQGTPRRRGLRDAALHRLGPTTARERVHFEAGDPRAIVGSRSGRRQAAGFVSHRVNRRFGRPFTPRREFHRCARKSRASHVERRHSVVERLHVRDADIVVRRDVRLLGLAQDFVETEKPIRPVNLVSR